MQTHINIFGEDANGVHINKINDDYLARYSKKVIEEHRDKKELDHPDGSVHTRHIDTGAVTEGKIAYGAVTRDKIKSGEVTLECLSAYVRDYIGRQGWATMVITKTDGVYKSNSTPCQQGQIIVVRNETGGQFSSVTIDAGSGSGSGSPYTYIFDRYIGDKEVVVCRWAEMGHSESKFETIMTLSVDEKVASNDILDGAVGMSKLDEEVIEKLNELDTNDKILKTSITKKTNTVEIYGTDNLSHIVKSTFIDGDCTVDTNGNGVLNIYIDVSDSSGITLDDVIIPIENATLTLNMSEALSPYEGYVTCVFDVLTHEIRWRIDNEQAEKGLYDTQLIFSPFSFEYDYNGENLLSAGVDIHNITKEYQYKKSLTDLQTKNKDSILDAINELASKNSKTIYVQCDGDHDELKLQEALANATAGDVVYPVGDCVLTNENTSTVLEKNIILMISMGVTFDGKYCGSITLNNTNPSEKQVVFYVDTMAKLKNITFTEENCTNETINPTLIYAGTGAEVSDCYFTEVFDANQSATEYSIYLGNYSKFLRNLIDGWYVKPSSASQYTFRALNNCMVSDNVIQSVNASADSLMGYFFSVVQSDFSNNIFKDVSVNSGRINVGLSMCQGNKFDSVAARFALGGTVSGCAFSGCESAEGYPLFSFTTRTTINGCSFRTCAVNEGGNFADLNTGVVFDGNTVYSLSLPESGEDIVFNAAQSNIIANNTITLDNVDNTGVIIVDGISKTVCTGNITNYSSIGRFAEDCVESNNITGA